MSIILSSIPSSTFGTTSSLTAVADGFASWWHVGRQFLLAAAVDDLTTKLKQVLDVIMLFGFLYGTIRIIGGAAQIRRGEIEEGKTSIVSGALIAAAPLIMRVLFEIFFNGKGL